MLEWMLTLPMTEAFDKILETKTAKGYALQDILTDIHDMIHRIDLPATCHIFLLDQMGHIE